MHRRGQGTFEYVLLLGGVLLVVVLAILVLQNTAQDSFQGLSDIELKKCKAAALQSPMCYTNGAFQPTNTFGPDPLDDDVDTLCDCSNFNPDVENEGEEEAEFSHSSVLFFQDATPTPPASERMTELSLRRKNTKVWFVLQHKVSTAYAGPLVVVLPFSKDKIDRIFPRPDRMLESPDGAGLTVLQWNQFILHPRQSLNVVAYLKAVHFRQTVDEIRSKIPKITAAKPSGVPAGFNEYVYPVTLSSSLPAASTLPTPLSCVPNGQVCGMMPGSPLCCSGIPCHSVWQRLRPPVRPAPRRLHLLLCLLRYCRTARRRFRSNSAPASKATSAVSNRFSVKEKRATTLRPAPR